MPTRGRPGREEQAGYSRMTPDAHCSLTIRDGRVTVKWDAMMDRVFHVADTDPGCMALMGALDMSTDDDATEMLLTELGNRLEAIGRRLFPG